MNANEDKARSVCAAFISNIVEYVALLHVSADYLRPRLRALSDNREFLKELNGKLHELSERLGGPPQLFIVMKDEPDIKTYDTYASSALAEVIRSYEKARAELHDTHISYIVHKVIREQPDVLQADHISKEALSIELESRFWSKLETVYWRFASFWDRVGQLLDFVFFHIRQYERDGFAAVMDRVRINFIPMFPDFEKLDAWLRITEYAKNERRDGLKWLLSRRNLLTHRLSLSAQIIEDVDGSEPPLYYAAYDHLNQTKNSKLSPESSESELNLAHVHFGKITDLFDSVIDLSIYGVEHVREPK